MLRSFLNNYFGFNKQQRNGLLILCSISLCLLAIRIIYPYFITPDKIIIQNLPLIERKLDSASIHSNSYSYTTKENNKTIKRFVFDPNTVTYDQLLDLGFKEKTAKTFLKFRDKGFVFKQKSDLKKIYGISDYLYEQLEPYILITGHKTETQNNEAKNESKNSNSSAKKQPKVTVELNSADSIMLLEIDGIGPSFAKRILKYKSMLGGFVSVEQLKEVYGFTDELFEKVKPFVTVDASAVKKINLNKDDFKTVNKHPYLTYELTKTIFNYRKKTPITSGNLNNVINDETVYKKLLPYLVFE